MYFITFSLRSSGISVSEFLMSFWNAKQERYLIMVQNIPTRFYRWENCVKYQLNSDSIVRMHTHQHQSRLQNIEHPFRVSRLTVKYFMPISVVEWVELSSSLFACCFEFTIIDRKKYDKTGKLCSPCFLWISVMNIKQCSRNNQMKN